MQVTSFHKTRHLLCALLLYGAVAVAQDRTETLNDSIIEVIDSLKDITPCVELNSEYDNKVVFWGRDFNRKQYGIESNLVFKSGKGPYLYYTHHFWSAMPNPSAKSDIGLGYERQFTPRLYASLAYERWFFNNGDSYVRKALANYLEAEVNYDLGWVNVESSFYYMFGLEHVYQEDVTVAGDFFLFSFLKSGSATLRPQFLTTFANQAFLPIYSNYPTGYISEKRFKLIDFELNLPLLFKAGNIEIEPNLRYNMPVKIGNEQISSFFYFSLRLSYDLYFDKGRIRKLYRSLK
jgi:hypothetical protein